MAQPIGTVIWTDITVPNADEVRDFYQAVIGWKIFDVDMGDYKDYSMIPPTGEMPAVGICHAQGSNAGLPPQWLIYVAVDNLDQSIEAVERLGGKVIQPTRDMGDGNQFCVIQDPAGAVMALFKQA